MKNCKDLLLRILFIYKINNLKYEVTATLSLNLAIVCKFSSISTLYFYEQKTCAFFYRYVRVHRLLRIALNNTIFY